MSRVHWTGDCRHDAGAARTRVYRTGERGHNCRRDAGAPRTCSEGRCDWKVSKWKGAKAAATNMAKDSDYLQVSKSCTLAFAHHLGLSYARRKKHYYADGHGRPDVLAHRKK